MKTEDIIVGIDLGSQNIKAGIGAVNEQNKLEIYGIATVESLGSIVQGEVRNLNTAMVQINKALTELSELSNSVIASVTTNISAKNMLVLPLAGNLVLEKKGKEVTYKDVETLADNVKKSKVPLGQILTHTVAQEFGIDGDLKNIYDPVGMPGLNLEGEYLGVCFSQVTHDNIQRALDNLPKNAKVNLYEKIYSALASSMSTLTYEERMAGVAMVDIGAQLTEIAVFHKNVLRYIATIPVGGDNLTEDLQIGLSILPEQAEKIKIFHGVAQANTAPTNEVVEVPGIGNRNPKDIPVRNVSLIIQERLIEMSAMILAKIMESGYANRITAGVVVTGGVARTELLPELMSQCFGKDVRLGLPNVNTRAEDSKYTANPENATLIGMLWTGTKSFDDRIKIAPETDTPGTLGTLDFSKPQRTNFMKSIFKKIMGDNPNKIDDKF